MLIPYGNRIGGAKYEFNGRCVARACYLFTLLPGRTNEKYFAVDVRLKDLRVGKSSGGEGLEGIHDRVYFDCEFPPAVPHTAVLWYLLGWPLSGALITAVHWKVPGLPPDLAARAFLATLVN